jgi:hypothetical protein
MKTPSRTPLPLPAPGAGCRGPDDGRSGRSLGADIIIANAPDPVFVSDLEGKILDNSPPSTGRIDLAAEIAIAR